MGDHEVILKDLRDKRDYFESKAETYGEDLGAPYRDAAHSINRIIKAYEETLPPERTEE